MTKLHWIKKSALRRIDSKGFTLIELMVAVLVASILVAIAVPSYNASVQKSRRTDAKTALLDLAGREERYLSTTGSYASAASAIGYSGSFPVTVGSGYYQLNTTITPGSASALAAFTATATPIAGTSQVNDKCGTYSLTSSGVQSVNGSAINCW